MNFSNYHKLSKVLSLILIITILCTLFAGCKKEEDPESTTPNTLPGLNLGPETLPSTQPTTVPTTEAPSEPKENMGTVTQQMNIRGTPSTSAAIKGTLYAGDRVEIIRQDTVVGNIWGYIKEPEEGWIVMQYVEMDIPSNNVDSNQTPASGNSEGNGTDNTNTNTNTSNTSTSGTKGVITGNGVNIRNEASINGKLQGSYNKGDVVTILETKDGWGRTDKGWVKLDYVNLNGSTGGSTNTNNNTNTSTSNNNTTSSGITGNGSTTVVARGVVKVNELNIRSSSNTNDDPLGSFKYGDRVEILEKDGSWGRTSKGWIHMDYIYQDGTKGAKRDTGTVTTDGLRIRSGPGTGYDVVGSYNSGDHVEVLEQFTYGNTTWGCTSKGWISLSYVDLDNDDGSTGSSSGSSSTTSRRGTVISGLYVRSGAGTNYEVVSSYEEGDEVTILETRNGWGRTDEGWVSLKYIDFDNSSNSSSDSSDSVGTGTVMAEGGLRVRAGAGSDYKVVSGLEYGDRVTILETKNGWGRINAGWISLDYIDMD